MTSRLYINANFPRKKRVHNKSDSEALADLESVFQDVDIDGEGLIDEASFLTSLRILGVKLPESEMALIFRELDEEETGMIEYDKVLKFMKMGKIPSTLLNRIKNKNAPKRKSILFGSGSPIPSADQLKTRTFNNNTSLYPSPSAALPIVNEKLEMIHTQEKLMDPQRLKMIQRAVIVIKRACMKKIKRPEVVEFLREKGMSVEDVDLAFMKAEEQVMTPEERLKSLQDLADSRLEEVLEQQRINQYLTSEITTRTREIGVLRDVLQVSLDTLLVSYPKTFPDQIPKGAADELRDKIKQTKKELDGAQSIKDERALSIYRRDLHTLDTLSKCVMNQQHFHGYLCMYGLDDIVRDSMPQMLGFLEHYQTTEMLSPLKEEEDEQPIQNTN